MANRPPTLLERLALRVLYDLATKVPKVILQRVEEVVPDLKIQIAKNTNGHLGAEVGKTTIDDEQCVKNIAITPGTEGAREVIVPEYEKCSEIADASPSNLDVTETMTNELQLSHVNMDVAPSNVGVMEDMTHELKLSHAAPVTDNDVIANVVENLRGKSSENIEDGNLYQENGYKPDSVLNPTSINEQDNTEAILLVGPVTGELSTSLHEECLQDLNTVEVKVLKVENIWQDSIQAVENNVIKIEEEINDIHTQKQDNCFENVGVIEIKREPEEGSLQEVLLCPENEIVDIKCEIKEEITIEEHEICLEDIHNVGLLGDEDATKCVLASMAVHNYNQHDEDTSEASYSLDDIPQISHVEGTLHKIQIKKEVEEDVSIQEQGIKEVYIKRIKDEIMQHTVVDLEDLDESSLETENFNDMTAVPAKYYDNQMDVSSYKCSEILKTSNDLVNLSLVSSKQKALKSYKELNPSMSLHTYFLCQAVEAYTCNLCGKSFLNASTLKLHYEIHFREQAQKCNVCSKMFHDSYKLKMHTKVHSECSSKLHAKGRKQKLHTRILKDERTVRCGESPISLQMHSRYHAGNCPYQCRLCHKSFDNANVLQVHKKCHNGERPHRCVLCSKTFTEEYQFTQHLRLHCKEKVHVCRKCNKCFPSIPALRIHVEERCKSFVRGNTKLLQVPSEKKPYACQLCSRTFNSSRSLKVHNNVHKREKSFGWW